MIYFRKLLKTQGQMLLSTYGLRTFALTTPVFIIQDPDASHRPTGSTAGYALRSG